MPRREETDRQDAPCAFPLLALSSLAFLASWRFLLSERSYENPLLRRCRQRGIQRPTLQRPQEDADVLQLIPGQPDLQPRSGEGRPVHRIKQHRIEIAIPQPTLL